MMQEGDPGQRGSASAAEGSPLSLLLRETPKVNPRQFTAKVMEMVHFFEKGEPFQPLVDLVGFVVGRHGTAESYERKFKREEQRSGHPEAASFGEAKIGDKDFILFVLHWEFFRGSFGEAVGDRFVQAAKYAASRKLPLVSIYSSAGARQQEATIGLAQMLRMQEALDRFREKTKRAHVPYISVLCETWGGLSASIAYGDVTIGVKGTSLGFSGPNVVATASGVPLREGAQSVEANYLSRNIDYLVGNEEELVKWLGRFLKTTGNRSRNTPADLAKLPPVGGPMLPRRRFDGTRGFASVLENGSSDGHQLWPWPVKHPLSLLEQSNRLKFDPGRIDLEDILRYGVTDVVPLYLRWKLPGENMLHYPAIAAAIGRIGAQTYLFIGNQPSYQQMDGTVFKNPAIPGPSDFEYLKRMFELGERLGLDCVVFTDTPGALPTEEAERAGISRRISEALTAGRRYKNNIITVTIGHLGSGGGLATAPQGEHVAMLSGAQAAAADSRLSAAIIYSMPHPSNDQVTEVIDGMGVTAEDQWELGLVDKVVIESKGFRKMIESIVRHIVDVSVKINAKIKSPDVRRRKDRGEKLIKLGDRRRRRRRPRKQ